MNIKHLQIGYQTLTLKFLNGNRDKWHYLVSFKSTTISLKSGQWVNSNRLKNIFGNCSRGISLLKHEIRCSTCSYNPWVCPSSSEEKSHFSLNCMQTLEEEKINFSIFYIVLYWYSKTLILFHQWWKIINHHSECSYYSFVISKSIYLNQQAEQVFSKVWKNLTRLEIDHLNIFNFFLYPLFSKVSLSKVLLKANSKRSLFDFFLKSSKIKWSNSSKDESFVLWKAFASRRIFQCKNRSNL